MLDRGCWITWYDLPEDGRDDYISWLHGSYIPARLKTPGVLWGASYASEEKVVHPGEKGRLSHTDGAGVPAGDRFILVFGGETAHAFADPTPAEFHASLTDEDRKMLAMRVGERSNILTEEGRADGPEAAQRSSDLTSAPCIQVGSFNCDYSEEDELAAWYAQWRLPSMEKLPGCMGVKKYASVSGWAKHVIFYEWASVQARNNVFVNHEASNSEMEDWTDRVVRKLNHAPGSPNLARRLWPEA
jgi:hypothetical protein